jgi:hypothetical protein
VYNVKALKVEVPYNFSLRGVVRLIGRDVLELSGLCLCMTYTMFCSLYTIVHDVSPLMYI